MPKRKSESEDTKGLGAEIGAVVSFNAKGFFLEGAGEMCMLEILVHEDWMAMLNDVLLVHSKKLREPGSIVTDGGAGLVGAGSRVTSE